MGREATDLLLSSDGDLVLENGDFKLAADDEFKIQSAKNRIKSIKKDWFYDHVGADMEEILGMPNTKEVAEIGKSKILDALTEDGLFEKDEVYIKEAPTGKTAVLYIVVIKSIAGKPIVLNVTLDLVKGVVV